MSNPYRQQYPADLLVVKDPPTGYLALAELY
jgi:hypothetical protein